MFNKLVNTNNITHNDWLEFRQKGIGGSDVGSILGLNQYKSQVELWLEKTNKKESSDLSDNEKVYWGNVQEETIGKEFSLRTGLNVRRNNHILQSKQYPFMLANIDFQGTDKDGNRFVLECKTASEYLKSSWIGENIPFSYELQVLHYLIVTGYDYGYIAVLIGGNHFVYKKIERDSEVEKTIIEAESNFWNNYIIANQMPPIDGSDACSNIIDTLYPEAKHDTSIDLFNLKDQTFQKRAELLEQKKNIETQIKEIDNIIKNEMGDNESAFCNDYKISWKNVSTNRFNSKKFKEDYPDLYEQYINQTNSRRFLIK